MKKAAFSVAAALLLAALATSCNKAAEAIDEPSSEIITVRFNARDAANGLAILEDPSKERYRNVAHFFCYQDGRMVLFTSLQLDTTFFEPLTLSVKTWSITPYAGPQQHYNGHLIVRAEIADTTIARDNFDFTFRLCVLLPRLE